MSIKQATRRILVPLLAVALLLPGCTAPTSAPLLPGSNGTLAPLPQSQPPRFINHPRPEFEMDYTVFESAGCPGNKPCEASSPLAALGCTAIEKPDKLLGGFEPSYPIAVCKIGKFRTKGTSDAQKALDAQLDAEMAAGKYLYEWSMAPAPPYFIRYMIFRNGQFDVIKTADDLRNTFAPIESPDEALSYVLVAKGDLRAYYGLKADPRVQYFAHEIEDTHVEKSDDGFSVHLFDIIFTACPGGGVRAYTEAVDMHVAIQGLIEEGKRERIHQDLACGVP